MPSWPLALLLVPAFQPARDGLVVAGHRLERLVGDAVVQHLEVEHPDQRVAALDAVVEEGQRLARGWPSIHSATLHRSTASGFLSTP